MSAAEVAVPAVAAADDVAGDAVGAGGDGNGAVAVAGDDGDPSRKGPSCFSLGRRDPAGSAKRYTRTYIIL